MVLILLLLEYPLGHIRTGVLDGVDGCVLILLLLEYPLGRSEPGNADVYLYVLILLLLEYPLGQYPELCFVHPGHGLNPSFTGIPSRAVSLVFYHEINSGLNPSFTGIPTRAA